MKTQYPKLISILVKHYDLLKLCNIIVNSHIIFFNLNLDWVKKMFLFDVKFKRILLKRFIICKKNITVIIYNNLKLEFLSVTNYI